MGKTIINIELDSSDDDDEMNTDTLDMIIKKVKEGYLCGWESANHEDGQKTAYNFTVEYKPKNEVSN